MSLIETIRPMIEGKGANLPLFGLILYIGVTDAMAPTTADVARLTTRVDALTERVTAIEGKQRARYQFIEQTTSIVNDLCNHEPECRNRHDRIRVPE